MKIRKIKKAEARKRDDEYKFARRGGSGTIYYKVEGRWIKRRQYTTCVIYTKKMWLRRWAEFVKELQRPVINTGIIVPQHLYDMCPPGPIRDTLTPIKLGTNFSGNV